MASIAFRVIGGDKEVDDVVQDVFVELVRAFGHLDRPEDLRGWLSTVTVRVAGKLLRRRRLRHRLGLDSGHCYDDVCSTDADPEDRALLQCVYQALDRLPAAERVAWTLRNVQGERLDVVAQHSGCSLATAKRRIAAAHQALRKELAGD